MRYDFLVVGNGPTGSHAAAYAAKRFETAIVGSGGRRVQCAGLISISGLKRIGAPEGDYVINRIRGARIHSPGGVMVEVDARKPVAYAVDRLAFDERLLEEALDAGAKHIVGQARSLRSGVKLSDGKTVEADRTILATGSDFTLQIQEGLDRPKDFLVGGQYEMKVDCDRDFVELHFCVPDFFAWVIPLGDSARVGLCVRGNPRPYLDAFVKKLGKRVKSGRILSESFGIIPVHDPRVRTQYPNLVTVGDAAGQVKASTGGGIIFGCIAAEHATAPDYERLWRAEIGRDLKMHLMIHRVLGRMSDRGKDRFFRMIKGSSGILERQGDMDFAEKTAWAFLMDPGFVAKATVNLPWLLADIL
ncbi:MAG: NAD(P)/FAD-dependent oxidoreductase [Candidatus Altiarchaeota archaeon]